MSTPLVLFEREGPLGIITLNRPEKANALNLALREELSALLDELARDDEVRSVVVTGAGKAFCAGADLTEPREVRARFTGSLGLDRLPQPVVAAINGAALGGGCELALTCDFRFMAEDGRIGLPEIRFGALPVGGGTARLPRIVGLAAAKRMIYTGARLTADEAARIGLVDTVTPGEDLVEASVQFARQLADPPAYALRTAKTLLNLTLEVDLTTALQLEQHLVRSMGTRKDRAAAQSDAARRTDTYARIFADRGPDAS